jgi:ethanolamine utilization protein EutN
MRIGEIIGRVTLSRCHSSVQGGIWKLVVPLDRNGLAGAADGRGEALILFDELGSGIGSLVAISDGAEAAAPFYPEVKPIDAYCAALLDELNLPETNS